jgi:K+:H+ antiporter
VKEILKEIVEMASRQGIKIRTRTVHRANPANAIFSEAKKEQHDLIVMGVSRRQGEKLFFGDTVAAVLSKRTSSILLLST